MKLTIALVAAHVLLKFDLPAPGRYYLFSEAKPHHWKVETCGYKTNACHVALTIHPDEAHKIFWVEFYPE